MSPQEVDALFAPIELRWARAGYAKGEGGGGQGDGDGGRRGDGATRPEDAGPSPHNSLRARAFIDCGASHGLVSHAFVVKHALRMEPDSSQGACLLGDGSASVQHLGCTEPLEVRCGNEKIVYAFHIIQTAAYMM